MIVFLCLLVYIVLIELSIRNHASSWTETHHKGAFVLASFSIYRLNKVPSFNHPLATIPRAFWKKEYFTSVLRDPFDVSPSQSEDL